MLPKNPKIQNGQPTIPHIQKTQLKNMLQDLITAAKETGLELHTGKTKALSNLVDNRGGSLQLKEGIIEVLPLDGSTEYLGKRLSLSETTAVDLQSRIEKAWKKFFANRQTY